MPPPEVGAAKVPAHKEARADARGDAATRVRVDTVHDQVAHAARVAAPPLCSTRLPQVLVVPTGRRRWRLGLMIKFLYVKYLLYGLGVSL